MASLAAYCSDWTICRTDLIAWEDSSRNDLLCVEWDVKTCSIQLNYRPQTWSV